MQKLLLALMFTIFALPVQAGCYVEYKAKQDNPLRLHYGIMDLGGAGCPYPESAEELVRSRLNAQGWELLTIVNVSTTEPDAQKQEDAGAYYLRF